MTDKKTIFIGERDRILMGLMYEQEWEAYKYYIREGCSSAAIVYAFDIKDHLALAIMDLALGNFNNIKEGKVIIDEGIRYKVLPSKLNP